MARCHRARLPVEDSGSICPRNGSAASASSSPAPSRSSPATASGHHYWTNGNWIGRASLNGTGVKQKFIPRAMGASMVAVSGGYLYWTNTLAGHPGRPEARLAGFPAWLCVRSSCVAVNHGLLGMIGAGTSGSSRRASAQRAPSMTATASSRSLCAGTTRPDTNSPLLGIGRPRAAATKGSFSW
jgi:hypothetical protein